MKYKNHLKAVFLHIKSQHEADFQIENHLNLNF